MKKILCVLLAILLIPATLAFVGCGEKTLQEKFAKYYGSNDEFLEINLGGVNANLFSFEKSTDYPSNVLVELIPTDENLCKWVDLSISQKKQGLKRVGDMVIAFAKSESWNNNYNIYITFEYDSSVQTIYHYETDTLYVPNCEDIFIEMKEKFGTCRAYEVEKKNGGVDWLVSKGLGEIKHGEYDSFYNALESMTITCYDGEFKIRNRNLSTAY